MQLYKLTEHYENLEALLDNEDIDKDIIYNALNEVNDSIEEKAENIAKLINSLTYSVLCLKEEEQRLVRKRRTLENRIESLKTYLQNEMRVLNKYEIRSNLFNIKIQKNPVSLKVDNFDNIPTRFFKTKEAELDRRELLREIKGGLTVEGVELQQTESIRIR